MITTLSRPSPAAYIRSNQIMGWGEKAIEIRSVETGHLDGVFMHKRAQRLKFLCERNDKVRPHLSRQQENVYSDSNMQFNKEEKIYK